MVSISKRWTRLAPRIYLCALCWVSQDHPALAGAPPSDPVRARGEQIAREICAVCHVVAADQEFPPLLREPTPSFSEIANRPTTTARGLQRFITKTHWDEHSLPMSMPDPMMLPEQMIAVSHYIMSLRAP